MSTVLNTSWHFFPVCEKFADILSKVILTGILDPIVGGVILGALLSAPVSDNEAYDHQANIKVEGNRIFLNGKPII